MDKVTGSLDDDAGSGRLTLQLKQNLEPPDGLSIEQQVKLDFDNTCVVSELRSPIYILFEIYVYLYTSAYVCV